MTTHVCAGANLVYVDTQASAFPQDSAYSCKGVVTDGVVSTVFSHSATRASCTMAISLPGCSLQSSYGQSILYCIVSFMIRIYRA